MNADVETATCPDCRRAFERPTAEPWRVRCVACYSRHRRRGQRPDEGRELERLRGEVEVLRAALARSAAPPELPPDVLRWLVQQAHPDRHGGSPVATKATAWLLGLRGGR